MSLIGRGSYGKVWAVDLHNVDKKIKIRNDDYMWVREIAALVRCGEHPHIIQFTSVHVKPDCIIIRMPRYHEDMYKLINRTRPNPLMHCSELIKQLLSALEHMQQVGVHHRDLKPSNIVLDSEAKHAVIIDFGMATPAKPTETPNITTLSYRAPEIALGGASSSKSDMWSLICIIAEMMGSDMLFHVQTEVDLILCLAVSNLMDVPYINTCGLPHVTDNFPPRNLARLITINSNSNFTLQMDPDKRPSPTQALCELAHTPVNDRRMKRPREGDADGQIVKLK